MSVIEGGPALPVIISTDPDIEGGPATPVWILNDWDVSRPTVGKATQRVKVLSASDLVGNGGKFHLEGRASAVPIILRPAGDSIDGTPVCAVFPRNALVPRYVYGPEKVLNGGFEIAGAGDPDFFANWTEAVVGTGQVVDETTLVHSGSHACKLIAGDGLALVYEFSTVVPGTIQFLTFWTRGDGTNAGDYKVYDVTNGADIIAEATTGVAGTTFTQVSATFAVPAGCTVVGVYFISLWAVGIAYFDDVSVRERIQIGMMWSLP